jgi:hypothetical protein
VVRGRESAAAELFRETLGYYATLQEKGVIESFEPVFLEPHGGDLTGFILIRGDAEKLAAFRVSEEFTQLSTRVSLIVDRFGVVGADLGGRLQRQIEYYTRRIGAFAQDDFDRRSRGRSAGTLGQRAATRSNECVQ